MRDHEIKKCEEFFCFKAFWRQFVQTMMRIDVIEEPYSNQKKGEIFSNK